MQGVRSVRRNIGQASKASTQQGQVRQTAGAGGGEDWEVYGEVKENKSESPTNTQALDFVKASS